jgi:hypothetical protein
MDKCRIASYLCRPVAAALLLIEARQGKAKAVITSASFWILKVLNAENTFISEVTSYGLKPFFANDHVLRVADLRPDLSSVWLLLLVHSSSMVRSEVFAAVTIRLSSSGM